MTPKQYAQELVDNHATIGAEKYYTETGFYIKKMPFSYAQIHAIITVEAVIKVIKELDLILYYKQVINEIETL
jgi:hypothetical protein